MIMNINKDLKNLMNDNDFKDKIKKEKKLNHISEIKDFKKKDFNYKCINVFKFILKWVFKNLFLTIKMNNEIKCIITLRTFMINDVNENDLKYIYYQDFNRLIDYFKL